MYICIYIFEYVIYVYICVSIYTYPGCIIYYIYYVHCHSLAPKTALEADAGHAPAPAPACTYKDIRVLNLFGKKMY